MFEPQLSYEEVLENKIKSQHAKIEGLEKELFTEACSKVDTLDKRLKEMNNRIQELSKRLDTLTNQTNNMSAKMDRVEGLLAALIPIASSNTMAIH